MKRRTGMKGLLLTSVVTFVGCTGLSTQSNARYQVGVGSAIYAGSSIPDGKTLVDIEVYFGNHIVRSGSDGRGCCYATATGIVNEGKPRGAVVALWAAVEYGDERTYLDQVNTWIKKPLRKRFFYAAAQPSRVAQYPQMAKGHQPYRILVSAGKFVVSEQSLDPGERLGTNLLAGKQDSQKQYAIGRDDTLYYKVLSQAPDVLSAGDDRSPWNSVAGVAITEAQFNEMRKCSPGKDCRWFLSASDTDLNAEQSAYAQRNQIRPADMKVLMRELERSRRQHERWL